MSRNAVLLEINSLKEILFGNLSPRITKDLKSEKWMQVANVAATTGILPDDKTWRYVRDTMWPNWRKRALAKLEKARQFGTEYALSVKLPEVDKLVLEILGTENSSERILNFTDSVGSVSGNGIEFIYIDEPEIKTDCQNLKRKVRTIKTESYGFNGEEELEQEFDQDEEEVDEQRNETFQSGGQDKLPIYSHKSNEKSLVSKIEINRSKKQKLEVERNVDVNVSSIGYLEADDPDSMFLKSIVPSMKQLGPLENLEFRAEVINLLKIKLEASMRSP